MNPLNKVLNKSLDIFGKAMQKTSMEFQMRSSLAAYGLIFFSLIFMFFFQIYMAIFIEFSWWNLFYALNSLCGIFIIYSMLVTTYMSYLQIKAVSEIESTLKQGESNE